MTVKVGVGLFTGQVPAWSGRTFQQEYREALDLVRLAEALGFDSAWVSEHHGAGDGYMPSLLVTLGAFAAATDRIELGTGVILAPFHDPLRLAEDAATVDLLSGGRLLLGLGLGWREEEFRAFGQAVSERVGRTVDAVEVCRRAWTGERFSYEGRYHAYDRVKVTPTPARPGGVPILLGGFTEPALRRIGRLGDGYIRSRGGNIEDARRALSIAEEGARDAGKDPSRLSFFQLQNTFVWDEDDDPEARWSEIRPMVGHQLGVYQAWAAGQDTPDDERLEPPLPDDDTLRRVTPAGTPAEVSRALRPQVEAFGGRSGGFHLIVRLHYPGMPFDTAARAFELFAERVLPALKGS